MMDDGITRLGTGTARQTTIFPDVTRPITEIGFGVDWVLFTHAARVRANIGVEWQNWDNYSQENGPVDVGFAGVVMGLGIDY